MEAELRLHLASPAEAEICSKAMSVGDKPGDRSTQTVSSEGNELVISISAKDLGALRATINSMMREAKIANDVLE